MSLTPIIYRSADAGAPALTGQVGSLIALLDAVLVTGYGSTPPAGWTKEYSGTNKAVYRNNPVTGTGAYLRVDDGATQSGANARHALVRAYETMTDVDSGVGPAPTPAQSSTGVLLLKSRTLSSDPRAWLMLASETFFMFFVDLGTTAAGWVGVPAWACFMGDFVKRKSVDEFNFIVLGSDMTSFNGSSSGDNGGMMYRSLGAMATNANRGYVLRDYLGADGAVQIGPIIGFYGNSGVFGSFGSFPDPVSGGLLYDRIYIGEGGGLIRGYLPNVYEPFHRMPFPDGEELTDIDSLPGTTILAKSINNRSPASDNATAQGQLLLDVTNYWG